MHVFISPRIIRLIDLAIEEDELGFDVTSQVFFEGERARAQLIAKQALVVAGLDVVRAVFARVDPGVRCEFAVEDGQAIESGMTLGWLEGDAVSLLRAERTALNFLQRMSGVASLTASFVAQMGSSTTRIVDTRKTLPGWRELDKYAVRCGGGTNHRFNLAGGVMIKDNHIAAAGGIQQAFERVREQAPHALRVEIEVSNLEELSAALETGAEIVMLDNMNTETMSAAVQQVRAHRHGQRVLIEASGNMTRERLPELRDIGLDFISVGALTHSASAVDISMRVVLP
ncbi:MAG: carboxylating nicotinate-nucleotide diphosphorylase [Bradymonadaceae bacterium]|nr:carboxylating nicotinate-nucleotide diphosphorylase [Lujinxingiaceae bacterium]